MDFLSTILLLITALLILFIISFCIFFLRIYIGKSLNSPLYAPAVATIYHQVFFFNRLYDHLTEFNLRHPTFRLLGLSHSELYTVDPRNVEHILKTNFDNYPKGEYSSTITKDLFGDGIFAVDGEKWREQRKLSSFEFSARVLRDFSCAIFRRNATKLAFTIKEFATQKQAFDIQELFVKSALDSIFEVGFGVNLNCLATSNKASVMFNNAFDEANALVYWRFVDFSWKIKRILNIGSEARLRKSIRLIDDFVYRLIKSKREMLEDQFNSMAKTDILSRFLAASQNEPGAMTDKYLRDIILNFILAGKDSTGNTLSWFIYMLCKHPSIQEKIFHQVVEVIEKDEISMNEFSEELTDAILDKMHYLHAALTETLRLFPAVPIDGRCAEADDVLPDGYKVNKGDYVFYVAYAMGRMKSIWGEDAEEFRPERWLENGVFRPESPFKFVAFHGGLRICLGKEFAYRQMKIVSMVLMRFFRFELDDYKDKVTYKTMFTLQIDGGLRVQAVSRVKFN